MLSDDILKAKEKGQNNIKLYLPSGGLYLSGNRLLKIKEITYKKALELSKKGIIGIAPEDIILADKLSIEIIISSEDERQPSIIRGYVSHS